MDVGFSSIVELSEAVLTKWQVKWGTLIKGAAKAGALLTTEQPTEQEGANIVFTNKWEGLTEVGLHQTPPTTTVLSDKMNRSIKRFAKGIQISRFSWRDPSAQSNLMVQLDGLVQEVAALRTRRVYKALEYGETSDYLGYDGKPIFANNHDINGNTFDNLLSNVSLTPDGFNEAKTILQQIPLGPDEGDGNTYLPTELATWHLFVPPPLEKDARVLLRSQTLYETNIVADNPFLNAAELHVHPFLKDPNDWYLLMTIPGITPFITLKHVDSKEGLIPFISENDLNVVNNNFYEWKVQCFEETYPVHFYQMVKVKNAASS